MSLFGADVGLETSLDLTFSKVMLIKQSNCMYIIYIGNIDLDDTWFYQDGAAGHIAHEVIQLLHESSSRVLPRYGDKNLPP